MLRTSPAGILVLGMLLAGPGRGVASEVRGCDDLYFGLTGPADPAAAYACFDAGRARPGAGGEEPAPRDWTWTYAPLVVQRLEGQGVERSLEEAARLMEEWQSVDPSPSGPQLALRRILLQRRAGLSPGAEARVELCDLPGDESFRARCEGVRRRRDDAERERHAHGAHERVPEAVRDELPALLSAFRGYADAERERVERGSVLEADADAAARLHGARLRAHFDDALRDVLVERRLPPATAHDASGRELAVEEEQRDELRRRSELFAAWEGHETEARRYEDAAQRSHAAWKRYRDEWVEVARTRMGTEGDAEAAARAVRVLLAKQRLRELRAK